MLARTGAVRSIPPRFYGEYAGQWIEASFLRVKRSIRGLPPVALEEARHYAIATASVPHECASGCQHPSEFHEHPSIVAGIGEEAERGEEIEDRIEASGPLGWELAHVTAMVPERRPSAALTCARQQRGREVERIDTEAGFSKEMTMAPLPAGHIEHSCIRG